MVKRSPPSREKLIELQKENLIRESIGGGLKIPKNIPRTDKAIKKYLKRFNQKSRLFLLRQQQSQTAEDYVSDGKS